LLPNYLRFVSGVVDSKDLPLNVSREILQGSKIIEQMRAGIVKRVLDMLEKLAADDKEKYAKFWQAFGAVLKEGLVEDFTNQDRIAKLIRLASTKNNDDKQDVALQDYCERMHKDQDKIYYITAEGFGAAKNSPHLEIFRKKDIEVLLLDERVDEWWLAHYPQYEGKKFQSVTKSDIDLSKFTDGESKQEQEKLATDCQDLVQKMQKVLGDTVKEVRISQLLTDSPVCIVTAETDMGYNLQRIITDLGQAAPAIKPILEINPKHALIAQLKNVTDEMIFNEWVHLFYDQAVLAAGGKLADTAGFVKRLNSLLII
jgi:molecular chaperone HtpG